MEAKPKEKVGLAISTETRERIDALAFALNEQKGEVVEEAVEARVDRLSPEERVRFEAAKAARGSRG